MSEAPAPGTGEARGESETPASAEPAAAKAASGKKPRSKAKKAKAKAGTKAKTVREPAPVVEAVAEPAAEPEAEATASPEPDRDVDAEAERDAKPEPDVAPDPGMKGESEADTAKAPNAEADAEPDVTPVADVAAESEEDATPEPSAEADPDSVPEAEPAPEPAAASEATAPDPVSESEPVREAKADSEAEPEASPESAPPTPEALGIPTRRIKSPWWAKTMVVFGVLLMLAAGGAVYAAKTLTDSVNEAVTQENLLGETAVNTGVDYVSTNGPLNFLMIGTDSRDVRNADAEARTDTIMVLHIPQGFKRAYLVSIPRDLWVPIKRCWETQTPCEERVNAAYVFGGKTRAERFKLLAETVSNLTGLKFDGAAIINFNSFKGVVDLVGGVELCLEDDLTSIHSYKTFKKGCKTYGPVDALDIVRQRNYPDGDFQRQRTQQQFVKSMLKRAEEEGYMSDPTKITTLIDKVGATLTVQCPTGMLPTDVAYTLRDIRPETMTTVRVPAYPTWMGDASVLKAEPGAKDLWAALRADNMAEFLGAHPDLVNKDPQDMERTDEDDTRGGR